MSWDLFVQDWGTARELDEIPDDFEPKSIGKRSEIISRIKEIEPTVNFSDPSWGRLDNEHFSIEFNMGDNEDIDSFLMHVRGNKLAIPCIGNILINLKLRASDFSNSNFFNVENSILDMEKWIKYRNKLIK